MLPEGFPFHQSNNFDRQRVGFIPDICRIAQKYDLTNYIVSYTESAEFPSKLQWIKIITKSVVIRTQNDIFQGVQSSDKWHVIKHILVRNSYSPLLDLARNKLNKMSICKQLIRCIGIFMSRSYIEKYRRCKQRTDNLTIHLLCFAPIKKDNEFV